MADPGAWYCVDCGVRLNPEHEFCWYCGARRWRGDGVPDAPAAGRARQRAQVAPPGLGGLRFFLGFWGVLLMVWATYRLAQILYFRPGAALEDVALNGGLVAAAVLLALLHAVAFHGVSAYRVSGWVVAVVVAGLWSVILVGLPPLYVLLLRSTREAFGLV